MKKKTAALISLLLCLVMVFTACGKSKDPDAPSLDDKIGGQTATDPVEPGRNNATRPTKPTQNQPKPAENAGLKPNSHAGSDVSEDDWTLYFTLKICFFPDYAYWGSDVWYGQYDDHDRIEAAYNILVIWNMMGYDTSDWTGNDLAQEMNNYYDQDTSLTIWDTACTVVGLDHSDLAAFYEEMAALDTDAYYWPDVDGDIWYWDGAENTYIGSGDDYYIADDGECYEYADPVFYYDEDGDIWYGIGDENDEFIAYGDTCYIGDDGELYTYGDDDIDADPFFWSDEEGVVWYWNGESNEFIGTAEEYFVDDEGNIYKTAPPEQAKGPSKFYWADEIGNVWYWNGEKNEFIGFGNECYVDNAGLHWYGGSSGDSGDYGDEFFYYDDDGDLWYWNGYEDEYIG